MKLILRIILCDLGASSSPGSSVVSPSLVLSFLFCLGALLSGCSCASMVLSLDGASRLANALAYALILVLNISFMAETEGIAIEDIAGDGCCPDMAVGVYEGRLQ